MLSVGAKGEKVLKQPPSLDSSSDKIEELPSSLLLEAITKETRSIRTNTTIGMLRRNNPTSGPNTVCMSNVTRGYKIVSKVTSLSEFLFYNLSIPIIFPILSLVQLEIYSKRNTPKFTKKFRL